MTIPHLVATVLHSVLVVGAFAHCPRHPRRDVLSCSDGRDDSLVSCDARLSQRMRSLDQDLSYFKLS